jgi:hypothetical protein
VRLFFDDWLSSVSLREAGLQTVFSHDQTVGHENDCNAIADETI